MDSKPPVFPCNTCSIVFESSELQRSHMRQDWHIYNLRRRVAELPALSEEQFDTQVKKSEMTHRPKTKLGDEKGKKRTSVPNAEVESESDAKDVPVDQEEASEKIPPTQCLFCNTDSPTLNANIDHMSSLHGLFIPSPNQVSDMESLLRYLAIIIFECYECLYCGKEKETVDGVQAHMRDKGHCMIKMDAQSELLDFWELSDSGDEAEKEGSEPSKSAAIRLSQTEMRLPSGAVINSRSDTTQLRSKPGLAQSRSKGAQYRLRRAEMKALTAGESPKTSDVTESGPSRSTDRRVAVRGEMGLLGISDDQRRTLMITERKMKKRESIAKAAYRHAMEQEPVKTMYYKTENPVYQAG